MFRLPEIFVETIRDAQERAERIYEPVIGTVVENTDPEKLGRVRVRFCVLPGEETSYWAPICSMGAGKQRGWFFLPEVKDEVVLMFEHGDIRRPVVIASLYNGQDTPPDQNDGANERRVFHSRENSRIELDDVAGTVVIEDGAGIAKITIRDNNEIELHSKGDACLHVPNGDFDAVATNISVKASNDLHMHSGGPMKLGANTIQIRGESTLGLIGKPTRFNPPGVPSPASASASCRAIPDPLGEGGAMAKVKAAAAKAVSSVAPTPSAPLAPRPTSRDLGSHIDRGVKAAVRGVIKGTFGGGLPGIPMPGSGAGGGAPVGVQQQTVNDAAKGAVRGLVKGKVSGGDAKDLAKAGAINAVINNLPGLLRSSGSSDDEPGEPDDD